MSSPIYSVDQHSDPRLMSLRKKHRIAGGFRQPGKLQTFFRRDGVDSGDRTISLAFVYASLLEK
jgi:hypothetical protein